MFFLLSIGNVNAQTIKINNVNFDASDSFMFLSTSSSNSDYKYSLSGTKLQNPDRMYFDIKDAIWTQPNNSYILKNSKINSVKISQFSKEPAIVRIVIYPNENYDISQLKIINLNNNILFKFDNCNINSDFVQQIYSDTPDISSYIEKSWFYEEGQISPNQNLGSTTIPKPQGLPGIEELNNIQRNFISNPQAVTSNSSMPQSLQQVKLRSKYFVNKINVKNGNALILGNGILKFEKPIYLTNPTRIVFDLPNAVVSQNLRNREFKLNGEDTLKIGQFENTKARFVITSNNADKYRIIYSFDLQSFLIANDTNLQGIKLFDRTSNMINQGVKKENEYTDTLHLNFSAPVIHSIKQLSNQVELNLYNVESFNVNKFKTTLNATNLYGTRIENLPTTGIKLIFQAKQGTKVDYYSSLDGKNLSLKLTRDKDDIITPPIIAKKYKGSKIIVILDAGHGGEDIGATRAGIYEKDINLDVTKRVSEILCEKGINVKMVRCEDTNPSLQDRVTFSENNNGNIFVSIHTNSSVKDTVSGLETHYYQDFSYDLANIVHRNLCKKINSTDRGLFKSRFYVINHTKVPAILVEIGYISNSNERNELLTEKRKQATAEAIANGILEFITKKK